MPSAVKISNSPEQLALIHALVDEGWRGSWEYTGNSAVLLNSAEGTLCEYLSKHKFLDYFQVVQLALNLGVQVQALAKLGKGLPFLDCSNIIVCSGFVITNTHALRPLEDDQLKIVGAVGTTDTAAPEIDRIDSLPSKIHISAIYYSIGLLCLKCLGIDREMKEIQGSKLFYLLQRCLRDDPKTREFLYI